MLHFTDEGLSLSLNYKVPFPKITSNPEKSIFKQEIEAAWQ
jgi:hypothetical protein